MIDIPEDKVIEVININLSVFEMLTLKTDADTLRVRVTQSGLGAGHTSPGRRRRRTVHRCYRPLNGHAITMVSDVGGCCFGTESDRTRIAPS